MPAEATDRPALPPGPHDALSVTDVRNDVRVIACVNKAMPMLCTPGK